VWSFNGRAFRAKLRIGFQRISLVAHAACVAIASILGCELANRKLIISAAHFVLRRLSPLDILPCSEYPEHQLKKDLERRQLRVLLFFALQDRTQPTAALSTSTCCSHARDYFHSDAEDEVFLPKDALT
jgi:hypothetical protein